MLDVDRPATRRPRWSEGWRSPRTVGWIRLRGGGV